MCARLPFTLLTDNSTAGEFYANGNLIGTDTSSPYSFSWTNVAAGTYTLSAIATDAQGASTTSGVRTIVVDAPPTISLVADPATAVAPASIVLTASANDADGTITKVEFFQGAALIATVNAPGPYTFTVNIPGAGIYSFSARATDNTGLTATSAAATVTVTVGAGGGAATIYYIYTDHLNTPRAITNEAATPVWTWDNVDPFGANAPNEDPDGDANNFVFNLRFPGQYFDRETNTHYNGARDYAPDGGRYIQSDPIGLQGGINTYAYVGGNPLSYIDSRGTEVTITCRPLSALKPISPPVHCSVFVWHWTDNCGQRVKVIDAQYSVTGGGNAPLPQGSKNSTYQNDTNAFNNPRGPNSNYNIPPPPWMTQQQFDQSVQTTGNGYSQGPYSYWPWNYSNSNTAAANIVSGAGGDVPQIPGAWGQPPASAFGP